MTHAEKLENAVKWLDTRWVLHPQNRVTKLKEPLPEVFKWTPKVLKSRKGKGGLNRNKGAE